MKKVWPACLYSVVYCCNVFASLKHCLSLFTSMTHTMGQWQFWQMMSVLNLLFSKSWGRSWRSDLGTCNFNVQRITWINHTQSEALFFMWQDKFRVLLVPVHFSMCRGIPFLFLTATAILTFCCSSREPDHTTAKFPAIKHSWSAEVE